MDKKENTKILIVCFSNLRSVPYISSYTNILDNNNLKYDVVYWRRYNIEEKIFCNKLFAYNVFQNAEINKLIKLKNMFGYANYVKKLIKQKNYNKIIILSTLPGVLLENYLVKFKKHEYILDIRDHSYEHIKWYYFKVKKLMKNAALNVISSLGFKYFLPNANTILCHNCSTGLTMKDSVSLHKDKIIISFIGQVRYAQKYMNFLESIKNNEKIVFRFYGFGEDLEYLQQYQKSKGISNIEFYGAYKPEEKKKIIEETDIIFNVYGNDLHVKYAVSNKYYDALVYQKPIIVSKGTTMEKITQGFSYCVTQDKFDCEDLIQWYENLNHENIKRLCASKLNKVKDDMDIFTKRVEKFLQV